MKQIKIIGLFFLAVFLYQSFTCTEQENMLELSNNSQELSSLIKIDYTQIDDSRSYGYHTQDIEDMLAATPMGSEVYLEDRGNGEWYLKIEKTFSVQNTLSDESLEIEPNLGEIDSSLYGETITI